MGEASLLPGRGAVGLLPVVMVNVNKLVKVNKIRKIGISKVAYPDSWTYKDKFAQELC